MLPTILCLNFWLVEGTVTLEVIIHTHSMIWTERTRLKEVRGHSHGSSSSFAYSHSDWLVSKASLLINRANCALWRTCLLSVTHPLPWWRRQTHPQDAESSERTSLAVFPVNLHTAVTDHWRLSSSIAAWVTILTLLTLSARPKMALVPANSSKAARGTGPRNSTKPVVETRELRRDPWVSRRRWRYSAERTENTQRLNQCKLA